MDILLHQALLFHVHVSQLHRYYCTWHYYFLFMSHWYTDTLFHWMQSFHIFYIIVTWVLCTQLYHVRTSLLPILPVYMHWLFLYSCRVDHHSYYMDYCYMYIPIFLLHDYFPLLILIFPLLDMRVVDMRCMELSATWTKITEATSRISHLLFLVSCYLVPCYQQSPGPIIVLHVPCTMLAPDTLCSLNII